MKFCSKCHTAYPNDFQICPKDSNLLRTTSKLLEGMIVANKYEILGEIGSGGMGTVYRARHRIFGEVRAIKLVSSRWIDEEGYTRRLEAEAITARRLQHPNAVRVDDFEYTEDGRPFIVMEYVQGKDLRTIIHEEGQLGFIRSLDLATQAAQALKAAHHLGIVHRDIKPDNILVVQNGNERETVKVLDFGIAKVCHDQGKGNTSMSMIGRPIGTAEYMPPEQVQYDPEAIDARSDLYSLGIVLYEMLTGKLPFVGETDFSFCHHQIHTVPARPEKVRPDLKIPKRLSELLMKALEKSPADRFQTADEMIAAMSAVRQEIERKQEPERKLAKAAAAGVNATPRDTVGFKDVRRVTPRNLRRPITAPEFRELKTRKLSLGYFMAVPLGIILALGIFTLAGTGFLPEEHLARAYQSSKDWISAKLQRAPHEQVAADPTNPPPPIKIPQSDEFQSPALLMSIPTVTPNPPATKPKVDPEEAKRKRIDSLLREATALWNQTNYGESLAKCNEILKLDPNNERAKEQAKKDQKALQYTGGDDNQDQP
jgi:tRNA A-37 threonylcarbamoyl transferase component Bud32